MRQHEHHEMAVGVSRPRILDLFCGLGGASMGYSRAGFDVVGVDLNPQPDYPFDFVEADALEFLADVRSGAFDLIHASPPCQAYLPISRQIQNRGYDQAHHQLLTEPTRYALRAAGIPYVLENPAARADIVLCGEMFGLSVLRHRRFEIAGWVAGQPKHLPHRGRVRGWRHGTYYDGPYVAVYGSGSKRGQGLTRPSGGGKASLTECQAAMGIDWSNDLGSIHEAIPPAYAEWIGRAFLSNAGAADDSSAILM